MLCIPVRYEGAVDRRAHPRVGAVVRAAARRARAHLRRRLQPLRPHDRRGRLPVRRGRRSRPRRRPRVGDGVIVLDASARVRVRVAQRRVALHRIGVHANAEGLRLAELGLRRGRGRHRVRHCGCPVTEEIERGRRRHRAACAASRCSTHGAVVRRRGAAARHLRAAPPRPAAAVEGRHDPRDPPPGEEQPADDLVAAAAAGPAARSRPRRRRPSRSRCAASASIALVHETLSREAGDDVRVRRDRPAARPHGGGEPVSPEHDRRASRSRATPACCPASVATPLAVVLNELLQNAVDHAFPAGGDGPTDGTGQVRAGATTTASSSVDGGRRRRRACPRASRSTRSGGLGLSIVRTLVNGELGGSMELGTVDGEDAGGTRVSPCGCRWPRSAPVEL